MIQIDYNGTKLEFREPNKMIYGLITDTIAKGDVFEAVELLVKNCYKKPKDGGIDLIQDIPARIALSGKLISQVFSLYTVNINTDEYTGDKYKDLYNNLKIEHKTIFTVVIDVPENKDKTLVMFIKPLGLEDYREVFNKSIQNSLSALTYIYENLRVGGDEFYSDDKAFASCLKLGEYLLSFKGEEIKKK